MYPLGEFTLRALTIADLDRDYAAVIESAADIKAANPGSTWPDGLTREKNLIDLAWHQREFEARRSFAWVIEDAGADYLGCLYVYPSIAGEQSADVVWWWRTGRGGASQMFREELQAWLASADWPKMTFNIKQS